MKKEEILIAQFVIVIGLIALSYIFQEPILVDISLGLGLLMLIFPRVGKIIVDLWFKLATILGEINAKVLLSITFFVFLYPMSFIYRITSKKPFTNKETFWFYIC